MTDDLTNADELAMKLLAAVDKGRFTDSEQPEDDGPELDANGNPVREPAVDIWQGHGSTPRVMDDLEHILRNI